MEKFAAEMQALVIEQMAGTITLEEEERLQKLIAETPDGLYQYNEMVKILIPQNTQEVKISIPTAEEFVQTVKASQKRKFRVILLTAAACILIALIGIRFFYNMNEKADPEKAFTGSGQVQLILNGQVLKLDCDTCNINANGLVLQNANKTLSYSGTASDAKSNLSVPAGKDYTVLLSDGTKIMLNSASEIIFPLTFTGKTREVTIKGEAFVQVAKDEKRPFFVHLASGSVQVLGTEFNVNSYDKNSVRVSLVSGSVKYVTQQDSAILKAGKEAVYAGTKIAVQPFDELEVLSWRQGIYSFDNIPLSDIVKVIPRFFGVNIVVDSSAADKKLYGFVDRKRPLKEFLEGLKKTNDVSYYVKGDVIHLK